MKSISVYDVRLMSSPRNHWNVTSLFLQKVLSFIKRLIGTEKAIVGQIFRQFLPFQFSVLFPVMTELPAKTAFRNLFWARRISSLTETCNTKSNIILFMYKASRGRRTRNNPPNLWWNDFFFIHILILSQFNLDWFWFLPLSLFSYLQF